MSQPRKPPPTWGNYQASIGDRSALFALVTRHWGSERALYPGCYLDLAPSTAIKDVTYLDVDKRAAKYFATEGLPESELEDHGIAGERRIRFIHADYADELPLDPAAYDVVISLYAGFIWDRFARYLAPRGLLLANTSHGDACIAALDPSLTLVGVVHHEDGRYSLSCDELDTYLIPKKREQADAELIRAAGKGIAYTRTGFAYIFQKDM
ncbi:class I SAM-dependent methyltransferase [Demequina sediminicola]|uniref:class I SAM-dependent methyltransferase n=1 Tax=Demequina sediminicola TaxID=1095026 RepID=UPI00078502C1|nr:class I SAM-dependent methyltransferase [Demequina sediminicola]